MTCARHGLSGKDSVRILDGTFDLTTTKDGIHASNDDDETLGYIYIAGGDFTICSQDDGINASGGSSSTSGNEPQQPDGNRDTDTPPEKRELPGGFGGNGGFDMDADESCSLTISGGDISIDAGGDGIDSNGYFYMTGGNVFVAGPESNGDSALDYGISASISGGTFLATGYSGMAQSFSDDSEQCSYMVKLDTMIEADSSTLTLTGAEGVVLLSHTTNKSYNSVIVSCPELTGGATYTLTTGSSSQEITP